MNVRTLAVAATLTLLAGACSDDTAQPEPAPSVPVPIAGSTSGVEVTEAQQLLPGTTATRDLPRRLGALTIWGKKVADLSDGRSLVIGRSPHDDPVIATTRRQTADGLADPITTTDPSIRLFVVDWETEEHAAVSAFPESHVFRNATGEHHFAEVVLEFRVEPGERAVTYSSGWNGAGYDTPLSLWIAPIPETA